MILGFAGLSEIYRSAQSVLRSAVFKSNALSRRSLPEFMHDQIAHYKSEEVFIAREGYIGHTDSDSLRCQLLHRVKYNLNRVKYDLEIQDKSVSEPVLWEVLDFLSASRNAMNEPDLRLRNTNAQHTDEMSTALRECRVLEGQLIKGLVEYFASMDQEYFFAQLSRRPVDPEFHVHIMNAVAARRRLDGPKVFEKVM